ncbi:MAG: hypothetical protein KJ597_06935 [Nanoarchaeota archaeon]|nr:hypothetical protein [Nanoarchaeota archaeon]MBU1623283.1 hypothetical protein [Nanoarchaeota archaeon]
MVEESVFRGTIDFMGKLGVYDIILPFLLVFTIVFAILEKTKILGLERVGGEELTKKNLNSIVAFVMAFLVVASTQLVAVVNEVMANIVLLLILAVSFLMLVGVFFGDKEFTLEQYSGWIKFFMVFMFIGIVLIFLNALNWLQYIFALFVLWEADWAATIIFFIVVLAFIVFITYEPKRKKEVKKE